MTTVTVTPVRAHRPLPLVMLYAGQQLIGRTEVANLPRVGELVSIEDPMRDVRHRFRVTGRERWFTARGGSLPPQEIVLSLSALAAAPAGHCPGGVARVVLVCDGVVIGRTVSTMEPTVGDTCSVEQAFTRERYRVIDVERWLSEPAPAPDGSTTVYRSAGTAVHLAWLKN